MTSENLIIILPLKNLLEIVCLRILDTESLYSLVILRSYIVRNVLVIVLSCAGIDIHDSRRNLSCLRVLQISKIERRNITVRIYIYHAACLTLAEQLVNAHGKLCAICKVISNRVLAAYIITDFYRTALDTETDLGEFLLKKLVEKDSL